MNKIEEKYGLNKTQLIALIVILVLNAYWLISQLSFGFHLSLGICVSLIELIIAIIYITFDYKKPHGNLMRYLLLLHVALFGIALLDSPANQTKYVDVVYLIKTILVSYMAGRLDHYKQNVVICGIVLVCNAVLSYYFISSFASFGVPITFTIFGSCLGPVTGWLAIAGGYIIRYKLHKEVGLEDKK